MKKVIIALATLFFTLNAYAEKLDVFVAASARYAMEDMRAAFLKDRSSDEIELSFGASGKAYAQFTNGRAYDMFFSADAKYADKIVSDGNAIGESSVYAMGTVALYSLDQEVVNAGLAGLKSDKIKKISIANPKLAPYGVAAVEMLKNSGIYDSVESKIVLGDNISQSVHFVDSGAADVGLVAYSLLKTNTETKGFSSIIDPSLYEPLKQSFVITKYGADKKLATEFAAFVTSPKGKEIIEKYGFGAPK